MQENYLLIHVCYRVNTADTRRKHNVIIASCDRWESKNGSESQRFAEERFTAFRLTGFKIHRYVEKMNR